MGNVRAERSTHTGHAATKKQEKVLKWELYFYFIVPGNKSHDFKKRLEKMKIRRQPFSS